MSKTSDAAKNEMLVKPAVYDRSLNGWYSLWKEGSGLQFVCDEYTAVYEDYDDTLFAVQTNTVHYGDANLDGNINIIDLIVLKKKLVNAAEINYASLDCDGNGVVESTDMVLLYKHLLGSEKIEWEADVSKIKVNTGLSGGADAAAAELKSEISQISDITSTGTVYKISESGADGTYTVAELKDLTLRLGDTVLFNRGETFRLTETLTPVNGVGYGAYGVGDKPVLSGSLRDYADSSVWTSADGFVWSTTVNSDRAANIVFNNGEYYGVLKTLVSALRNDGDFCFDSTTNTLYLYLQQINPGSRFWSIEISSTDILIAGNNLADISFTNIGLSYAAVHGMNFRKSESITVTGCEFNWIGGGFDDSGSTRYGNALQFWSSAENCKAISNSFNQIFDAAVTFQGNSGGIFTELEFKNNLIEYTSMNFEFWDGGLDEAGVSTASISNVSFDNNIVRFAGYGFSSCQRGSTSNQACILAWHTAYSDNGISNFDITNNIFDVANCYIFYATGCLDKLNVVGNTYYQSSATTRTISYSDTSYAHNLSEFNSLITAIDATASTYWID